MTDKTKRIILALAGLGAWASIAVGYFYLEKTLYLTPCNLCMMQRLAFFLVGLAFLVDAIFWAQKPIARYLSRAFKYLSVFFGIGLASRHLYIQSLPADKVPSCGFDFYTLMDKSPSYLHGLWTAMHGDGDCAIKDTVFQNTALQGYFFDFRIPVWSMILFVILLFVCIFTDRKPPENTSY